MSSIGYPAKRPALSRGGLALVLAAHAAAFAALWQMEPIAPPRTLAVLSASLLPPAETRQPEPETTPPKPKPPTRQAAPLLPPVPLAAPAEAPGPTSITVSPAPTFAAAEPTAAPPSTPATPSAPRFDAAYLDNPKPVYPPLSRRAGEQGRVVLRVRVSGEGHALEVQLHASSGHTRLDDAALDAVKRWRFVPARLGTESVVASVLVPIVFSLKD